ncbi:MAG: Transposase [uncultured bacterium]|nr:MAG: Transposase [uncultured bacterium]
MQIDKGHGRLETRTIRISEDLKGYTHFPYLHLAMRIDRTRDIIRKGVVIKSTHETAYCLTSLTRDKADAEQLLALARGHWGIENQLHWVRDWTYDEDRCQIRNLKGARAMATLRNLAISMIRLAGYTNIAETNRKLMMKPGLAVAMIKKI